MKKLTSCILIIVFAVSLFAFGACSNGGQFDVSSSAILADGSKLLTVCSANNGLNDVNGENLSPDLKWKAVDGAACYYIIMVDISANYWLHWAQSVTVTELALGQANATQYVGPYPPSGDRHVYRIYVFALSEALEENVGVLDAPNSFSEILNAMNEKLIMTAYVDCAFKQGDNNVAPVVTPQE